MFNTGSAFLTEDRMFGIGLRPCHYQAVVDTQPAVDWFEIVSEDFMVVG